MIKYVEFINKYKKPLFLFLVLINVISLIGVFRIRIDTKFDIFVPNESEYKDSYEKMNNYFSTTDDLTLMIEIEEEEITFDSIKQLRSIQNELEIIKSIEFINGPTPKEINIGGNIIDLDIITENQIEDIKDYYNNLGEISPLFTKDNKVYASFTIFTEQTFNNNDIKDIETIISSKSLNYYMSGNVYMQRKIIDYILIVLCGLIPFALFLVFSIFYRQMGSLKATLFSILPAGLGALWTVGLIGWIGEQVSIVTVLAPLFTVVIGSADGLHFVSHVQEIEKESKSRENAIIKTLKMVGVPMIITTVTSIVGFLSLLVMDTDAIKNLALFASLGILLAGIATWYVLPLILLKQDISIKQKKARTRSIASISIKKLWGIPSIAIVIIIIAVSLIGFKYIKSEFNQLMIYKEYTNVYKSFDKINEVSGGSVPVFLLIESDKNILEPSIAKRILELENKINKTNNVNKTISVYDFIKKANISLTRKDEYPTELFVLKTIQTQLIKEQSPVTHLVNLNENVTRIMLFPKDLLNNTLDNINNEIEKFKNENTDIKVSLTGVQFLMRDLNNNMNSNQLNSILLAIAIIFILLLISLRKLIPALVSLVPILCTVIILYGFLGFSGISLNVITTTIFSITLGVGIDYAVHFTSVWMSMSKKGNSPNDAVNKAYEYASRPIIANAMGLAIGLSALILSPLKIHLYVSTLMWISMIVGVFLSLSLLPTILRKIKINK